MVFFFLRTYQETPGSPREKRDNEGQNKIAGLNSMSPAILCITNQVAFLLRFADFFRLLGTGLTHQYLEHVFLFGEKIS